MKKIILSLTVLMSIVGTTTSFGSTKQNVNHYPKQETVINHSDKKHDKCDCKTCRDLVKKQQPKKDKSTCNCSNCKKLSSQQIVTKQPVKTTVTGHFK